ncbi:MAG: TRAP transporter small permease [Pseudomonadota bacterium]
MAAKGWPRTVGVLGMMTRALALCASVLLLSIGMMLTYEVVARYFFNAPTVWAEELSRLFLIWAVFLASAWLLRTNEHIRVTIVLDHAPPAVQRMAKAVGLLFVAVIAGFVAWNGFPIAAQSFEVGRTTGSMLDIPSWWAQASVPLGFALIALQAVACAAGTILGRDDS